MINKKKPLIIIAALIIALFAVDLHAAPEFSITSPQNDSTLGRFENNADHYMNVRNYAEMDFEKWWGAVSYKKQGAGVTGGYQSGELAQLGFATRLGSVYMGLSYSGSPWKDFGILHDRSSNLYSYSERTINGQTWKVFNNDPYQGLHSAYKHRNEVNLLIGVANMGFRLYYSTNYQSIDLDNVIFESGGTQNFYKSMQEEHGNLNPGIVWGMTKELIPGRGVKPQVSLDLNFIRNNKMVDRFITSTNPDSGSRGTEILTSSNKFVPGLNVGLYGFNFYNLKNISFGLDIEYGLRMHFYNNDYSYPDGIYFKTDTYKGGRVTTSSTSYAETFQIENALVPSLQASWSMDRLALIARLRIPFTTNKTENTSKLRNSEGSMISNGLSTIDTFYAINPLFNLSMQWAIIPNKLFLNAGGQLNMFQTQFNTIERKSYSNGNEIESARETLVYNTFSSARSMLLLGTTWNITNNIEFQAALGVGANNNISVFGTVFDIDAQSYIGRGSGGLLNFGNILVSLKF